MQLSGWRFSPCETYDTKLVHSSSDFACGILGFPGSYNPSSSAGFLNLYVMFVCGSASVSTSCVSYQVSLYFIGESFSPSGEEVTFILTKSPTHF